MKRFILFLIFASGSYIYPQWQLATTEPYNIAFSVLDKDGYVFASTNRNEFFRYSPDDSSWTLIATGVEPAALYVNDNNELIRGMKEYSADKGETWNPISFTAHEYSAPKVYSYKNIFILKYYDYTSNRQSGSISKDGGHSWEEFKYANYGGIFLSDNGLVAYSWDDSNIYTSYLFPDPNGDQKIELTNEDSLDLNVILSAYGVDSLGKLFVFDQYQNRTRCFRLEDNNSWALIDNDVRDSWTGSTMPILNIYGDLIIAADRIYKFTYKENGSPLYTEIFAWPHENDGTFINDSYNGQLYSLAFSNNIYLADLNSGTYKSLLKGIPAGTITSITDFQGNIYAGTENKGIYKSENGTDFYMINEIRSVEALIPLDTLLYSSASVSDGTGSELQCINYPDALLHPIIITHINQYYTNKKEVLFSCDKGIDIPKNIVYSRDLTYTMASLYQVPDSLNVTALYTDSVKYAIAYDNNNVLITDETLKENGESTLTPSALTSIVADQEGSLIGGSSNGVYKLENPTPSGKVLKSSVIKEWAPAGLEGHKINVLYNDITDSAFVIYAGTDEGVFYSTNNGSTWNEYNSVNPKLAKNSAVSNKVTGFSVHGGSVFANINNTLYKAPRIAYPIGIEEEPNITVNSFELKQNYPNPFNPVTNISFTLPKSANVKLTVYNVLGQEVEMLVNMNLGQGSYNYKFDGSKYASGMYIYSLETPGVRTSKKMMLLK